VRVVDAGAEQQVEESRQQRVADVAVEPRHRPRLDVRHPVADDEVGAVLELGQEPARLVKVVGQVGIGHQDELAARLVETGQIGASVAATGLEDHACAGRLGEQAAAVV
jgi:hypothetical protein